MSLLRVARCALAALALAAVATQFASGFGKATFHPANFFSYLTILSNLFGAFVLSTAAFRAPSRGLDLLRGQAVTVLTIVGVVYAVLLAHIDDGTIVWVNDVLHRIVPVAIVADWLFAPPATRLSFRDGLLWLAFPLLYVAYTLARGALVHWYPYPFLNVDKLGYPAVLAYCAGIAAFALVVALLVVAAGNALAGRRFATLTRPQFRDSS